MTNPYLVGILSGLASALLFATVATGSMAGLVLFYFATLPLFIAGLGWGWLVAVIGAATGALGLIIGISFPAGLVFFISVGLPAGWISHLALLSRSNADGQLEWYPVGRLVLWMAGIGATLVSVAVLMLGPDFDSYRAGLAELMRQITAGGATAGMTEEAFQTFIDNLVAILPPASAVLWLLVSMLNLYLAGRILRASERLQRPWPDLSAIDYPPLTGLVTGVAALLSFLPGVFGTIASVYAAVLILCHAFVGLAVVHVLTRGSQMRTLILSIVYLAVLLVLWPLLFIAALGAFEPRLNLRAKKGGQSPGASPPALRD